MAIRLVSLLATATLSLAFLSLVHAEPEEEPVKPIGLPSNIPGVLAIKAAEVVKLADYDEEMVIFDVRSATERKKGKISWSESFQSKQMTAQHLADSLASKDTVVVFYGNKNSTLAAKGAKFAVSNGYKSVYWFTGGWSEWTKSGLRLDM
jgi:rhodanese-related sulfurtransferase